MKMVIIKYKTPQRVTVFGLATHADLSPALSEQNIFWTNQERRKSWSNHRNECQLSEKQVCCHLGTHRFRNNDPVGSFTHVPISESFPTFQVLLYLGLGISSVYIFGEASAES